MLLNIAKSKQSYLIIYLPLMAILLWIVPFQYRNIEIPLFAYSPLAAWINTFFGNPLIYFIIFLFIIVSAGIYINYLNTKFIILSERSYLPGIIFIILSSVLTKPDIPAALALLLVLFALGRLVESNKIEHLVYHSFDVSLLFSLSSILYFPSSIIILVVLVGLVSFRPFFWREWVYTLTGLIIPYFFLWIYLFITDQPVEKYILSFANNFSGGDTIQINNLYKYVWVSIVTFMIVISSLYLFFNYSKLKFLSRKIFTLLFILFLISSSSFFYIPFHNGSMFLFTSIPLSLLFSFYFIVEKKAWVSELIFYMLIILHFLLNINS